MNLNRRISYGRTLWASLTAMMLMGSALMSAAANTDDYQPTSVSPIIEVIDLTDESVPVSADPVIEVIEPIEPIDESVPVTAYPTMEVVEMVSPLTPLPYHEASMDCSVVCSHFEDGTFTYQGTIQDIDAMWRARFEAVGWEYRSPALVEFDGNYPLETNACATMAAGGFAAYCPVDETIYIDPAKLDETWVGWGPHAVTNVLSHEFGHHIQHLTGAEGGELQANCLVGVYMADGAGRGVYDANWVQASVDYMGHGEDVYVEGYGTPSDQANQWMTGYYDGTAACGLPW